MHVGVIKSKSKSTPKCMNHDSIAKISCNRIKIDASCRAICYSSLVACVFESIESGIRVHVWHTRITCTMADMSS